MALQTSNQLIQVLFYAERLLCRIKFKEAKEIT